VELEEMLLKPNMVLSGYDAGEQASPDEVARQTIRCLRHHVPAAVPGIVFLSGGQSDELATKHLNAINRLEPQPWALSFSYGRRRRRRGPGRRTTSRPRSRPTSSGLV